MIQESNLYKCSVNKGSKLVFLSGSSPQFYQELKKRIAPVMTQSLQLN